MREGVFWALSYPIQVIEAVMETLAGQKSQNLPLVQCCWVQGQSGSLAEYSMRMPEDRQGGVHCADLLQKWSKLVIQGGSFSPPGDLKDDVNAAVHIAGSCSTLT